MSMCAKEGYTRTETVKIGGGMGAGQEYFAFCDRW